MIVTDWPSFATGITANVPDTSLGLNCRDQDERTGDVLTVPSSRKFKISSTLPAPVTEFNRYLSRSHTLGRFAQLSMQTVELG